jgi:hypothetical protein
VTPEKLEQFELLIQDHRSIRRLADETLNDERVVTADNAQLLVEAMRRATVAEETERFEERLRQERAAHRRERTRARDEIEKVRADLTRTRSDLAEVRERDHKILSTIVDKINRRMRFVDRMATAVFACIVLAAVVDYLTAWLAASTLWRFFLSFLALVSLLYLIADLLQWQKPGVASVLNWAARWKLDRELRRRLLTDYIDESTIAVRRGQISVKYTDSASDLGGVGTV